MNFPGAVIVAKFGRARRLLFERRGQVLRGIVCMPLSALTVLWTAVLIGQVIDLLRRGGDAYDAGGLLRDCALLAVLAVADALLRFAGREQLINASRHMEVRLKAQLAAHVQSLPIAWFDRARTGDLLSRLTQDVELVRFVAGPTLLYGTSALVMIPGGIWQMVRLSPLVALAALGAFALLMVGIARLMPKLHEHSKAVQESIAEISQRAAESFAGIRVLMVYARGAAEIAAMRGLSERYVGHNVDLAKLRGWFNLAVNGCRELVVIAVVVIGAFEVSRGRLTIGELLTCFALLGAMVWPLIAIGWIVASWHRAVAAADRIEEIFAAQPEPNAGRCVALRGEIEIRGLTFHYSEQAQPALRDIDLDIAPGQRIGLVGPIGSGKSTLLAILLRLYDPPRGSVRIDGIDLLDLAPQSVRALFAAAPQDPFLFSDTLAGNIRFGGAVAEDDAAAVGDAAAAASLDRDLAAFPAGWETVVGERGVTLSGGQKQRVSLARALAANRAALLLDDTLSAVDHATERRILSALERTRGDRTVVVVAHRLSIVAHCDLVLVFDQGRIVARGRHEELLREPGYYADAWRRQTEETQLERGWAE